MKTPQQKFTSDHPDRSKTCFPCYNYSCDAYHQCYLGKMEYEIPRKCSVCGETWVYHKITPDYIATWLMQNKALNDQTKKTMEELFTRAMQNNSGGYHTRLSKNPRRYHPCEG